VDKSAKQTPVGSLLPRRIDGEPTSTDCLLGFEVLSLQGFLPHWAGCGVDKSAKQTPGGSLLPRRIDGGATLAG
jgi:hypothetical protein